MNIKPLGGPAPSQNQSPSDYQKAQSTRARAIAALTQQAPSQQPEQQVVENQSKVTPEELSAVKAQITQQVTEPEATQNDTIVDDTTSGVPEQTVDTAAEKTAVEDPALSRQFAQLARQERALRAKAQQADTAIKAREAALAAREAEIATKEQEYKQGYISKQQLKQNPLQTLLESEVTYDDITQQLLSSANPVDPRIQTTISKLEAKIQQLEKAAEETQKTVKSGQQQAYDNAVKQIKSDVERLVSKDPNFETIKATGSSKDVVDLIVRTFNEDGILMSVEEAATEVENHILEEAVKLSRLGKVMKKIQAVAPQSTPAPKQTQEAQPKPSQPQTMKTLTNASASSRPLSARERALLAFKGELK